MPDFLSPRRGVRPLIPPSRERARERQALVRSQRRAVAGLRQLSRDATRAGQPEVRR